MEYSGVHCTLNLAGLLHNFILEEKKLGDNDTPDLDKSMFHNLSQTTDYRLTQ